MLLKSIVDGISQNSLAAKLRRKRFALFTALMSKVPRPLRILDVGGTEVFWKMMDFMRESDVEITLFNRSKIQVSYPNFTSIVGDARDMGQFGDNEYDVVFSNSLIEHVGSYVEQKRVAHEIVRIGKRYFVQTPNYYFPIEPHFLFPFFQHLPLKLKVFLLRHFNLGWYKKTKNHQKATETVNSIRLLRERELKQLFPGAKIYREKFFGLTKSLIFYKGW